jgi:hypothetical protein
MNPFVKRKKENYEKNFAPKHQPKGLAARKQTKPNKNSFSCFLRRHSNTTLKPKALCRLGHPEQARIVSPVATHYSNLRARRSFAF